MKNTIIILSILILMFSFEKRQNKDFKKFTIVNFYEKRIDTLKPDKAKSYYAFYVKIEGQVDDSVKVERKGYYDIILSGKIDTLINGDYYGTEEIIWVFNPYKATKGNLEIEYSL